MILVATVPLAILMSALIARDVRVEREAMLANLQVMAKAVAVGIDRELTGSIDALHLLAQAEALQRGDLGAFEQRLREPLRPAWERMALLGEGGALRLDTGATQGRPVDAAELERLRTAWRAQAAPAPIVLSMAERPAASAVTWVAVPTTGADGSRYLVAARIAVAAWQALLAQLAPEGGGFVTLFDAQHRIVARTPAAQPFAGALLPADLIATMGKQAAGVHRPPLLETGDDPAAYYGAWQLLAFGGWGVGVGMPAQAFDTAQQHTVVAAIAIAAACLVIGVSIALLVAQRIARPLQRLATLGAVDDPNPQAIEVQDIDRLRDALVQAERERQIAAARLAAKAQEFEALFLACPTGLAFAHDADCSNVVGNAAFDALMPCEAAVDTVVTHAGQPLTPDRLPLALAARSGRSVAPTELEIICADHPTRHVLASAAPLVDAAGRPRGAIGSVIDVTAQKNAERALGALMQREHEARQDAEAANRAKDELLSTLGHELRNPLNAITTSVEVLRRAGPTSTLATSARAVLARQTRHLASMVDQLLDVGRLMADEITLQLRPVRGAEIVERAAAAMRPIAAEREQQLVVGPLADGWVRADPDRLEQVLAHLLDNAIRFTPAGGRIEVDLTVDDSTVYLAVRDDGPGIDAALIERIFEPFVQGESGLDRSAGGLGLGLTLVKRLTALHGGTVRARASAGGSVFEICLPLLRPPVPGPKRVGVVDDNPDALAGLRSMLELAGHAVLTASDGPAGLAMLLADAPALAVVDIGLPGIDGYEVARRSRAAGYRGRLIALSGYGQGRDAQRSIDEGFDAHLVKPVDPELLMGLLADEDSGA
jgi:signal transduction histidine kinase